MSNHGLLLKRPAGIPWAWLLDPSLATAAFFLLLMIARMGTWSTHSLNGALV
jgi:hypothetical protein